MCILVDKILARITNKIVAVSDSVLTFSANLTEIDRSLHEKIPNCVPIDRIREMSHEEKAEKKRQLGIEPDIPIILSVGRLTEQKGYPYLFRAAGEVIRRFPDAVFLVVGKGELRDELEQQIRSLGLERNVRLLGFRNDIYELMQTSSVFAMPSLWEGLPVTLIEAGACRLPVVATNVGGIMEVIKDGENGLIVPMKDEQTLAQGLISLLSSPQRRFQMGERARQIVEVRFSGPAVARRIESLYRQFLLTQALHTRH
jgi:glycosyltransferase involved in cell wall biosynthesis